MTIPPSPTKKRSKLFAKRWTPKKQSLLMYFESCLVDNFGNIDHRRMNQEEVEWANKWADRGLIEFSWSAGTVRFSRTAWSLAHRFRRKRSERMIRKREEE